MADRIVSKDLGPVSAYAIAKAAGYTGPESEWAQDVANLGMRSLDAEAFAAGTRGGEPVESTDPAYHNNAPYYLEQAETAKTESETAMETAVASAEQAAADKEAAQLARTAAEAAQAAAEELTPETVADWLTEHVGTVDTTAIDDSLSVSHAAADAKVTGDSIGMVQAQLAPEFNSATAYKAGQYVAKDGYLYRLTADHAADVTWENTSKVSASIGNEVCDLKSAYEDVTEQTRNKWAWGNQSFIYKKTIQNVNIPAGTYTISATVLRESTASVNTNTRIIFYKNSVASANLLANPYLATNSGRESATFTLSEKADIAVIFSSVNDASSVNVDANWTDIQLESGSVLTDYIPPETATDFAAREELAKFESETETKFDAMYNPFDSVKEFEGTLTEGTYEADVSLPKNEEHPFIVCIDAKYMASGNAYPYLYFSIRTDRNFERTTMRYKVGEKGIYDLKEYRSIPYVWDNRNAKVVVVVPSGCSLTVRKAYCYFDRSRNYTDRGLQFHAHDGCCGITPPQTLHAFKMAYAAGYNSAIVIPKVTSEGVWFAYHDDTFVVESTYLRNADGTAITESEYNGKYFNEIPWTYLKELITGNYGTTFNDSHLMTLDDFFAFCTKTGISPMFSMHPRTGIQTAGVLASLKALVKKYGLLDKLIIKMPLVLDEGAYSLSNFTAIFSVFGNEIASYEVDAVQDMNNPASVITLFDGVSSGCTVRKVIEWWASQLSTDNTLIASAIASGYEVSCAQNSYTDISGATLTRFSSEFVKQMITLGVTEFTDNYNMSNGLYW